MSAQYPALLAKLGYPYVLDPMLGDAYAIILIE
jgi:hypothetical protein